MARIISIDWRPHNRRAKSLAQDIGSHLYLAPNLFRDKWQFPMRYLFLCLWTLRILLHTRPELVIVSAPPPFCAIIVCCYSKLFNSGYIVDASHLSTVGFWSKVPFGFRLNRLIMNQAVTTLVHNECIKELTDKLGIRSMVMETKIPDINGLSAVRYDRKFSILVPCSFDADEPIWEIFKAAEMIPDIQFIMTGDYARLDKRLLKKCPENILMAGFLTESQYDSRLRSVNALMVLSTDDYPVRPRGASEAIAAEIPLIVSRNPATVAHLDMGTILIDNTWKEMVRAVDTLRAEYGRYAKGIKQLKAHRQYRYRADLENLMQAIVPLSVS